MPDRPEHIHAAFADAVNSRDLDRLVELFEEDAVVVAPAGEQGTGERREGLEAIRGHLERLLAMRPTMTVLASAVHQRGDLALLSSHWRAVMNPPDGQSFPVEARGSELARRQADGTWRLAIDNPGGADS